MTSSNNKIVLLDAGSQFAKLIDKKIRLLNVCCDIMPIDTPLKYLTDYSGIIISGGPNSVYLENSKKFDLDLLNNFNKPILGICYGMQLLAYLSGASVQKQNVREDGQEIIELVNTCPLFKNCSDKEFVLLTHGDSVIDPGNEFRIVANSETSIAAIEHLTKPVYGVQFHPEVDLTVSGTKMFKNFIDICGVTQDFTVDNRVNQLCEQIREFVGDKTVIVLMSGGVDSTVCFALISKAINSDQVIGIHIDTGFMRKNESLLVKEALENIGLEISIIDAKARFLNGFTKIGDQKVGPLYKTCDPETKRKIIGDTFMHVIDEEIARLGLEQGKYMIAQGTLRPDLIESASSIVSNSADVIKTHHNDTNLVREKRNMGLIIEPLKDFHKDEVREIGLLLGLPHDLVSRQPFPGPGLAIRILCADEPFINLYEEVKQSVNQLENSLIETTTLLPIKSVGIQGDGRTYSYVLNIQQLDNHIDWSQLCDFAKNIPKKVHQINRITCTIMNTIVKSTEWTFIPTHLENNVIDLLKNIDHDINQIFLKHNVLHKFSQVPIILIPVQLGKKTGHTVVIRTFLTNDFMTGVPAIPNIHFDENILFEIANHIVSTYPVSTVLYDLTAKPPATTEWE